MLKDLIAHGHKLRVLDLPRRTVALHAMAVSAGYEQRVNEVYSWDGLQRGSAPFILIQHTIAGRGRLDFAGTSYTLTPGQTMVLSMPHAHRYWLERGQNWEYFWMVLNGREALRLGREIIDAASPVLVLPEAIVDRLAEACLTLIDKSGIMPGEASSAAYAAVSALHDGVFGDNRAPRLELPGPIARAVAYAEANLEKPVNVERMAAAAQLSRAHFVRQFSAALGTAPSDYLLGKRLERAERLLLATDMPVGAIASACGFANGNYLAKTFGRVHGVTPTQYRAVNRHSVMMSGAES